MTIEEAREYWCRRLERAENYSDEHWDAEERHEHKDYVDAMTHAITALAICRENEKVKHPITNGDHIRQMADAAKMPEVRLIDALHLMRTIMDHEISMSVCMTQDEQCGMARMRRMAIEDIDSAPTIEAEPVRHGEWRECWHTDTVCASICTNCGKAATQARHIVGQEMMTNVRYPLCPNCGARMDATDTNVGGKGGADNG